MTKMDSNNKDIRKYKILRPNEKLDSLNMGPDSKNTTVPNNNSSDDFDNSARIFKSINDVQRFLEVKRSKAITVLDLFTTSLEAQRMRLKSYCERLMFKDPIAYGREAKDILWKKCYYDVINTAKQLRSNSQWQPDELSCLQIHLQSGIGHYHHILQRFQQEFQINSTDKRCKGTNEVEDWAYSAIYCCLIHLGDLSRYKLDIYPTHNMSLPACYYYQALYWRPHSGLPHNQLATLYNAQGVYIDAAYHYYRCLNSPKPFEGTSCNLRILADKNKLRMNQNSTADSIPIYKLFVEHFVFISYALYYDQPLKDEVKQSFISYFESCLSDMQANSHNAEFEDSTGECSTLTSYTHIDIAHLLPLIQRVVQKAQDQTLDSRSLMKLMATFFLLCYRAKKSNSKKYDLVMNLTFHLMDLILVHTIEKLNLIIAEKSKEIITDVKEKEEVKLDNEEDKVNGNDGEDDMDEEDDDDGIKKILNGCKRRLRRRMGSNDSLNEESITDRRRNHKETNGDDSEEELLFDITTSDEEADEQIKTKLTDLTLNGHHGDGHTLNDSDHEESGSLTESCFNEELSCGQNIVLKSLIQLCDTESLIQTIRLFIDWLSFDKIVLLYQSEGLLSFMKHFCEFLNLLKSVQIPSVTKNSTLWSLTPLEEDLELRGMPPFHHIHFSSNWCDLKVSKTCQFTQAAIRISRMRSFGELLTTPGVEYLIMDKIDQEYKVNEDRKVPQISSNGNSTNGVHKGHNHHQPSMRLAKSNGLNVDKEDSLLLSGLSNMTQMSNNSSPNPFSEDFDKGQSDDEGLLLNNRTPSSLQNEDSCYPSDEHLSPPNMKDAQNGNNGMRLMKDMGSLWLKSEVNHMESKVRQNIGSAMNLPPYLVLDTEALSTQSSLVKQLVYTKKFIFLIPNVVIQELDELKRTSGRVRDTIRWLEVQLRSGNRFLRGQRSNERKEIPYIKYPKKKDKEAWTLYQVLECCYYLASKMKPQDSTESGQKSNKFVTLLTGHDKDTLLQFGASGVAVSAGIEVENITTFFNSWKSITKSPG